MAPGRGASGDLRPLRPTLLRPGPRRGHLPDQPRQPVRRRLRPLAPGREAAGRPRAGPGLQPEARRGRLALGPFGGRDRHRRHAVPGRFRHRRARPARHRRAARHPPGHPRAPRRQRRADGPGRRQRRRSGRRHGDGRLLHAFRDRPPAGRRGRGDRRSDRPGAGRRAPRRRGLAGDARHAEGRPDRAGNAAALRRRRRGRRRPRFPQLARQQLHLPRLPRLRLRRQPAVRAADDRLGGRGLRPRAAARGGLPGFRRVPRPGAAAAGGHRLRLAPGPADGHQVQPALAGAPLGAHGRDRRQAHRRAGRRHRRAHVRRPVHRDRLQPQRPEHSAAQAQAQQRHRPRRLRPARARRPGADQHHRDLPARRAVPDPGRPPAEHGARHPRSAATPAGAAVPAPGRLRALRLVHRLPADRALHHQPQARHPVDPGQGLQRHDLRPLQPGRELAPRPAADRRPHHARRRPGVQRRRARGRDRRCDPQLAGPPPRRAARGPRRGPRADPLRPLPGRLPAGLQGALQRRAGGGRRRRDRADHRRRQPGDDPLPALRQPRLGNAVQGVRPRRADRAVTGAADAGAPGPAGDRRGAARGARRRRRHADGDDPRLRPADPLGRAHRPRRRARQLPGGVPRRLAGAGRKRPVQRPGAGRRPLLARGRHRPRLLPLPPPGRHRLLPGVHGTDADRQSGPGPAGRRPVQGAVRPRRRRRSGAAGGADPRGHCRRARPGGERRPGPDLAPLLQPGRGDAADQLLPARRGRRAETLPVVQARQPRRRRAAAAPADVRDLRLLAADGGHPPARRQGRPRRHPLVGPARGLPHRDPRPDEGADGQERGDRAGGRQGRVRPEAGSRGLATARRSRPRASPATRR